MKGRKQNGQSVPSPSSTPFFARVLEDQRGGDAGAKAPAQFMTLKYPSDRDEIEPYVAPYGNAAGAP